ncbi:uncharacterized protein LOC131604433 [Vicia villosa]|uniref:uncharacterized protein LOC131604433 n=1 Tax=Vicia villosa TaxID=3911 RepID=UPI00273B6120|nr:uncharacterized protein LOC131604433 [Vicia villosa]
MKILSWNCRGLSNPRAIPNHRKLAHEHRPEVLFLSKTLAKSQKLEHIRVILKFEACLSIDVEGRSGGITVLWRDSAQCSVVNFTRNFVNILIKDESKGDWRLTCYYGFLERGRRKQVWDMLRDIRDMSNVPWCVIGDFNDLLSQQDKRGNHEHPNWLCVGFRQVVNDCDLNDIPIEGHQFTWIKSRGTDHVIEERLDRALANSDWLSLFPNEEGIRDVVHQRWTNGISPDVVHRISSCAEELEKWNKKRSRKQKEELEVYKAIMENCRGNHDPASFKQFCDAQVEYNKLLILEDTYWKQRAKMHRLREGDLNTKFFHLSATARRNSQKIDMLMNENMEEVRDHMGICEVAKNYFTELFTAKEGNYDPILNFIQASITEEDNDKMLRHVSKEELHAALLEMHPDKSLGPDGFNPDFYQKFRELCSDNIFEAVTHWLDRGFFPSSINETNVCLIPKTVNPNDMKNLRPISLCNVVYKMV